MDNFTELSSKPIINNEDISKSTLENNDNNLWVNNLENGIKTSNSNKTFELDNSFKSYKENSSKNSYSFTTTKSNNINIDHNKENIFNIDNKKDQQSNSFVIKDYSDLIFNTNQSISSNSNINEDNINTRKSIIGITSNLCRSLFSCVSKVVNKNYMLNEEEEFLINKLEKLCYETYNSENSDHEKLLKTLVDPRRKVKYENLGFVSQDPRNEFKEGGILSLKLMNHFLNFFPHEFMDMKLNKFEIPFVSICIQLTFLGYTYSNNIGDEIRINKKELKKLSKLLVENDNIVLDFLSKSLVLFKTQYNQKKIKISDNNDYEKKRLIDEILKEVILIAKKCLSDNSVKKKLDVIEYYDNIINRIKMLQLKFFN